MNEDLKAALIVFGVIAVALSLLVWLLQRKWRAKQATTVDPYDVGPDVLQLLNDLDKHLETYVAADTELAAGFDRLRQAIRDEQQKGEL